MENKKKNITTAVVIICVIAVAGIAYAHYKRTHAPVNTEQIGDTTPSNTTITPEPVKGENKGVVTVTPTKAPTTAPSIEVKTAKDQVIKDIVEGNYDKAKTEILAEINKTPKDAELWYIDSSLQAQVSDFIGAMASVKNALAYDPQNTTYWKWEVSLTIKKLYADKIANTSSLYRDTIKALYIDALKATNSNIEIITPYAIYLASIGDKTQAITYWQMAIKVNPMAKSSYETEIAELQK